MVNKEFSGFPTVDRVIFEDSPLEEVICQLRFNEILILKENPPATFQDRIRKNFPVFSEDAGLQIDVSNRKPVVDLKTPTWRFSTEDQKWSVSLTSNFLAFTSRDYEDFVDFWSRLNPVLKAFQEQYAPPFYTRVGLRYVNRFVQQPKDPNFIGWSRLLHQQIAGEYGDPVLQPLIAESKHHMVLRQERGLIGWRYSRDVGEADGKEAERFTLDFDHFINGHVGLDEVSDLLHVFNIGVYRLFIWCLTEEGYRFLKPAPKAIQSQAKGEL